MKQYDTLNKVIFAVNNSENEIKIEKIETGCGCTLTKIEDSVIRKKDSLPIYIRYVPISVKDSGFVRKFVTIRTNSVPFFKNIIITGNVTK